MVVLFFTSVKKLRNYKSNKKQLFLCSVLKRCHYPQQLSKDWAMF